MIVFIILLMPLTWCVCVSVGDATTCVLMGVCGGVLQHVCAYVCLGGCYNICVLMCVWGVLQHVCAHVIKACRTT